MNNFFFHILRISAITMFIGRGWQHFAFNPPYRVFLWKEDLLGWFVNHFTPYTWQQYVSSDLVDQTINLGIQTIGVFFLLMAFVTLFIKPWHKKFFKYYVLSTCIMSFLSFTLFVDKGFYIGQLIEHSLQTFIPLIFALLYIKRLSISDLINPIKVVIALTFIGHGLFAAGFYPVPGNFVDMVISFFGMSEIEAYKLLRVMGAIDFAAAIMLFIPRLDIFALIFMSFWGSATASARLLSNIDQDLLVMSLDQWWFEVFYRIPHGLVPFSLLYLFYLSKQKSGDNRVGRILQPRLAH